MKKWFLTGSQANRDFILFFFLVLFLLLFFPIQAQSAAENPAEFSSESVGTREPVGEIEEQKMETTLNLIPLEKEAELWIALSDLLDYFNWQSHQADSQITIKTEDKDLSFGISEKEFMGTSLQQGAQKLKEDILLGPDLLRLIIERLTGERLHYLSWLEIESQTAAAGEKIQAEIYLWNISGYSRALNFNSGQNYEIVLLRDGKEKWSISEGRAYTMALREVELEKGEYRVYQDNLRLPEELAGGPYNLSGWMVSQPAIPLNSWDINLN